MIEKKKTSWNLYEPGSKIFATEIQFKSFFFYLGHA